MTQRQVQQMGRGVVALGRAAQLLVDRGGHPGARAQLAQLDPEGMEMGADHVLLRVLDRRPTALPAQPAAVADLAAGLGVERRFVEHHHPALACRQLLDRLGGVTGQPRQPDHGQVLAPQLLVADEAGRRAAQRLAHLGQALATVAGGGPRALPLLLQGRLEAFEVEPELLLLGDLPDHLERQPVGVVETEDGLARQPIAARAAQPVDRLLDLPRGGRDGGQELLLLAAHGRPRGLLGRLELAVDGPHDAGDHRQQPVQERLLEAQPHAVAERAPQDPAQHVAAPLAAGDDAVGEQEGHRPQVVGDHPQRDVGLAAAAVGAARELGGGRDQRPEQVGVVVRIDPLQHRRDPLEPGAGVDRGVGQRPRAAVLEALELHEDQVPDLEVAAAVGAGLPVDRRQVGLEVDEDLAARSAGAGIAHRPEVVLGAAAVDALGRQRAELPPEGRRLVVLLEDRGREPVGRQAPDLGDQLPGEADRLFLEVVPEREVPQHLEEGVVARAGADVLEVVVLARDPHALLGADGARRRRGGGTEEAVLELDHAGVGEQQGGIVLRHQRPAGKLAVAALGEVVDEAPPDLVALHDSRFGRSRISARCRTAKGLQNSTRLAGEILQDPHHHRRREALAAEMPAERGGIAAAA